MDDATRTLSSGLAGLLRHNEGGAIEIDGGGWADASAALEALSARRNVAKAGLSLSAHDLPGFVAADGKGRFELSDDGTRIRAVSGHSFEVDLPLVPFDPQGPLFFGTVVDMVDGIVEHGLTQSAKLRVRLSATRAEADAIAESRGAGGPAVFEVDALSMAADGHSFGRNSAGEVISDRVDARYLTLALPSSVLGR